MIPILMFLISILLLFIILIKKKGLFLPLICSLFIIVFMINPKGSITSCISGAKLFFYSVFPSIFPFIVFCNMLIAFNGVYFYSKVLGRILCKPLKLSQNSSLILIISALCGYPLGAKYCYDLYEKKIISRDECDRLINIASNPSPLFITGTLGTVLLNNNKAGIIILFSVYLSCVIMGIFIPRKNITKTVNDMNVYIITKTDSLGNILRESIKEAIVTCSSIMGYIVIFSVITDMIKSSTIINTAIGTISIILRIPKDTIFSLLIGGIEMTNGCKLVAINSNTIYIKIALLSFIVSFSGFSIITQVYSFTSKFKFSLKKYVSRKFIQGLICSFISLAISYFLIP